jgi:hypothetical protein
MATNPDTFFEKLRSGLLGNRVSFRRLACDTLLLYVGCEPGDRKGITIWFDPIWHLRGPGGVLLGSMQVAEASDSEEAMAAVADEPMAPLLGRLIEGVAIDPMTFDLSVGFEGGYCVCTFAAHAKTDESWHIRENATGARLKGSPMGLTVQPGRQESR